MAWASVRYGTESEDPNHVISSMDLVFSAIYRIVFLLPFAASICISATGTSKLGELKLK